MFLFVSTGWSGCVSVCVSLPAAVSQSAGVTQLGDTKQTKLLCILSVMDGRVVVSSAEASGPHRHLM